MRALVTGGAGLIGSHIVDRLLAEGWRVRVLDVLEPQTHRRGRPPWTRTTAEFVVGSVVDRDAVRAALEGVEVVFHQAIFGGFMPAMAKYAEVNTLGTAILLEEIDSRPSVRKLVLASSQVVYPEGTVECSRHGRQFPPVRGESQLARGDWEVHCPVCGGATMSVPTDEDAPLGGSDFPYVVTKLAQERLVMGWARRTGLPTVALRYACTYGPRQSIFNPYTGVIAIFGTRLLAGQPPILYEDGLQTRDFCFVEDIATANLLAATSDAFDGRVINIGSGRATAIRDIARLVGEALGVEIAPIARGEFRPGEIRHLVADIGRAVAGGYRPTVSIEEGIGRYVAWIRAQGEVRDYFAEAEAALRARRIVQPVRREG